jgi:hypothetical protein
MIRPCLDGAPSDAPTSAGERATLGLVVILFLALNLLTGMRYPIVWVDEVMFADPAAHLYLGQGFHSTAWPYQDADHLFAGYPPLYPLLLAGWMALVGLEPAGVRALNYALAVLAAVALWLAVARLGLVTAPASRLTLVTLVLLGYGVSLGYRSGRPDTLMLLLAALALLAFTVRSRPSRALCLVGVSSLLPLSSLATAPFAVMLAVLLLVYGGPRWWRECACLLVGLAVGVGLLLGAYAWSGVLGEFWETTHGDAAGGMLAAVLQGRFRHENRLPKDASLFPLLAAGGLLLREQLRQRRFRGRSALSFGLVACGVVPLGMALAGKFPTYYNWMAYVPLAIGVCSALAPKAGGETREGEAVEVPAEAQPMARREPRPPAEAVEERIMARREPRPPRARTPATAVGVLVTLACLLGLPLQLALAAYDWGDRAYPPVERMVAAQIRPEDRVYCDYGAYFAAKAQAAVVYTPRYLHRLTARDREQLSALIIAPDDLEQVAAAFGGAWSPIGRGVRPRRGTLFADVLGRPLGFGNLTRKYDLQVYRRR